MPTTSIYELIKKPLNSRDEHWEREFLFLLPQARFSVLNDTPQTGPDNWPYLLVEINSDGTENLDKTIAWLHDKGVGLVLNPDKDTPDFVLSYGMVWNYKERKELISNSSAIRQGQVSFNENKKVLAGAPSGEYLPVYAKTVIRSFLKDNGVLEPKILVISEDSKNFDLCFSLESFGYPDQSEHNGILEALSWFLPAHYSLVLISETGLPRFHSL